MITVYSEQSKIEMEKYLTNLAIELIEKGYWETNEKGISRRMDLTIKNIAKLQRELKTEMIYHIFEW